MKTSESLRKSTDLRPGDYQEERPESAEGSFRKEDAGDVTKSRPAEAVLRETESRFQAMVDAFDGLIYICSPDYRVEFMNRRLIERTGYDGTGEYCYKVLHERDSICPWCVNERVFQGETVRWEVQSPKDNRWYYVVNTPIYHSNGRVSKQAMIQDISEFKQVEETLRQTQSELERRVEERTAHLRQANEQLQREIEERRQIEDRLRESEVRFLAFMQHMPGGAVIRDLQGRYLFANKAWEKAFAKEWQGKTLEEIWSVDTAWHMRELDQKAIATGEPVETEVMLQQEDGPHTWLINRFPILGQDGQPVLIGSAGVDVTKRREAEMALETERQRLFSLLDELPVYVYLHGPDHTVRFANRIFREQFGDSDGRLCYEILRGRSQPCEECSTERALTGRSPQEAQWTSSSGHIYQIYSYPFADVDGSLLVLKLGIDITERKQVEAEIRLNEARLASLLRISQYSPTSIQELLDYALDEAIALTGSKIGYIYFYDESAQQFTLNTWSKEVMQVCAIAETQNIYQLEKTGIWGEAVRQARPIMVNDFQAPHPLKKGYPEGHAPLHKYLSIPVISGNRIVAVVGVANKATDYDDADVRQLTLMMDAVWKIVERQRAQDALLESERRVRQLVEHAADGFFLHDKGKILEVNQQACDSLGYTREELQKMSILDIEVAISSHDLLKSWEHKTESPVTIRGVHRRKNGSTFPVEVRADDIIYGGRRLRLALVRDITERLQAEEALRQSELKYRSLVVAAPFGISIIGKDGRYKYLNPKFEEMFGYALNDIPTGREWFAKAYPDSSYRKMVVDDWKVEFQRPRVGEVRPRTFWVRCKDGTVKVINFRSVGLATGECLIFYEDITKRVQAEEALVKSEEQYRLLVNQIPAVVFKGYADGRVEFFDRKIESLTGYQKEDFDSGRLKWTDLILPEDAPGNREVLLKALKGNRSYVREFRIRKQDGEILWIQGRGQIFCNDAGRIEHISGVFFDISEREQAEEALRQSELKYRTLVEQIPAVVFQGHMDWSIDYFDRKIEALTGYAKEDFDSRRLKWGDLIPPEEMSYVKQTFLEALKTDKSYVREHRIRKKDGEYAWVQCRGRIFCDAAGKAENVRGVVFDITARKRAEDALKESEARYRLLAENVSDVIWTADMNLKLSYVSPSCKLLLGFSPEEVIQQGMEAILTPASLEQAKRIFAEEMRAVVQESRNPIRSRIIELQLIRKDGSIAWTEVKPSFLRDEQGRPIGILGVSRDISKRKKVELTLRRREAILEAVSFATEKFLQTEPWEKYIQNILGRLGQSADASRVYIFENHLNDAGELLTCQRYEWAAPGIEPQIDNLEIQNIPWRKAGFGLWKEQLSQGQIIVGHAWEFPPSEQELLAAQNIKSIVAVPIFVGQQWWGMIGLDECLNEREWSPVELEALKTAASILGAAILHERAEQALRKSEQKLRSLTAQLLTAQENERKRLAAELHDELGHALLTLKLSITSLEKQLTPEQIPLTQEFMKIRRFIVETIKEVRRLYLDLSPGDLEDLGLTEALRDMIEDVASLQKEVAWSVMLDNLDGIFPLPVQTAIYRVIQEALTNIGKHAKAKNISILAKRESHRISITIEDDGRGFDTAKVLDDKRSLGLLTMEERVKILGGTFTLWSQKKRGTRISFTVPLP